MLLKNFIAMLNNNYQKATCLNGTAYPFAFSETGIARVLSQSALRQYGSAFNLAEGAFIMDVGFGDTAENYNDYALDSPNMNAGSLTFTTIQSLERGDNDIFYINGVFQNMGGTNVTVREIGFYCKPASGTDPATPTNVGKYCTLIIRKVLETPVTIAPGEAYSFSYTLRLRN